MGIERLALVMGAAALLQFCGSDDADEAEVPSIEGTETVSVEADVGLPSPQYGGTVVSAGQHPVEVLPYEDGTIYAYVRSPEPPPPSQTQITVRVPADDGDTHPVLLVWDPSEERYRGQLRRVHPAPGPVEVVVVHDGNRYAGSGPRVVVVGPSPPAVVVRSDSPRVVVQRPSTQVVVERPSTQVVVERPRPNVQVQINAPRPRHEVVIQRPGVRVEHSSPRVRVRHDNGLHLGHRRGGGNVRVRGGGRGNVRVRGGGGRGHGGGGRVRVRAR